MSFYKLANTLLIRIKIPLTINPTQVKKQMNKKINKYLNQNHKNCKKLNNSKIYKSIKYNKV